MTSRASHFQFLRAGKVVLALTALVSLTAAPAAGQDSAKPYSALSQAQSEGRRLLATQAARVAIDKLGEVDDAELKELKQLVLRDIQLNPVENHTRAASEARTRDLINTYLQTRLDTEVSQIAATMLAEDHVSADEFRKQLGSAFQASSKDQMRSTVSTNLQPIFAPARDQAVASQVARLKRSVYPSQQDVDNADQKGWDDAALKVLLDGVRQSVWHDVPNRFEETEVLAEKIADDITKDVDQQRKGQLAELDQPIPDALVTRGQIETAFREAVEATVKRARAAESGDRPVYNMLPSVRRDIVSHAAAQEDRRWNVFIHNFTVSFNDQDLAARITGDLAHHRTRADSQQIFLRDGVATATRTVVDGYAEKAAGAPDLADFRQRLQTSLANSGSDRDALEDAVNRSLAPALNTARSKIADQQFQNFFAPLASGVWQAPEEPLSQGTLKSSDIRDFASATALPAIRSPGAAPPRNQILIETEARVTEATRQLVEEEQDALRSQDGIVEQETPTIEQAIAHASNEDRARREVWIARMTELVTNRWSDERPKLWRDVHPIPAAVEHKYTDLFGTTRKEIEKTVDNLLAQAAAAPPQPAPVPNPAHSVPTWVWVLLALLAVAVVAAAAVILIKRSKRDEAPEPREAAPRRRTQPAPSPPSESRPQIASGAGSGNGGPGGGETGGGDGTSDGGGGPGGGGGSGGSGHGGPEQGIPFEGLVIEVRNLGRTLDTIGAVTDLRAVKQAAEYAVYKVGPITISFVQEGNLPPGQPKREKYYSRPTTDPASDRDLKTGTAHLTMATGSARN